MKVLITGAGGLIGYEATKFFSNDNNEILGIDNNMRKYFFGDKGDTSKNIEFLKKEYGLQNYNIDIRDRTGIENFFKDKGPFDLIIHTAAQPSHDWAAREPFTDFDVNANGTINMLESFRKYSDDGVFVFTSTNKVYGDNPNKANLIEEETRWEYSHEQNIAGVTENGINEEMSIDNCTHSIFGASKVAADVMAQEYGRYFNLNVGVFRGGCLTGPQHSAVELHGYLTYIVDCAVKGTPYTIFGYKGKQVRDQIHSYDVINAFYSFYKNPRHGEVYNLGGTKQNSVSILETIELLKNEFGLELKYRYDDKNRIGDHICYYSDMSKFKKHYPDWKITRNLIDIITEIVNSRK